jgi:flavin reductase (DIM6/NTAB) family NADH-FMN oxidoreductase RutF
MRRQGFSPLNDAAVRRATIPVLRDLPDAVVRDFRDALGSFATGVTVLTALAPDGEPIGVTISSFNAVSLQPPLILWSLACDSPRLDAFPPRQHYAVNVLAVDQQWISDALCRAVRTIVSAVSRCARACWRAP